MKHLLLLLVLFLILIIGQAECGTRVDLNRAKFSELTRLPHIGEKRANTIIRSRKKDGPFRSTYDLVSRKLLSSSIYSKIKNRIYVLGSKETAKFIPKEYTGKVSLLPNEDFQFLLTQKIKHAKKSIYIVTFLFKTTRNRFNQANRLVEKLSEARKKGVDVVVLLEKSGFNKSINQENRSTLRKLAGRGIKVRFDSKEKQTHTKLAVIDREWTFIGSHNLSHSALAINNELSVLIHSKPIAKEAIRYFESID